MKKLIIAEKPDLARLIVSAIGKMTKNDGYFENEQYIVTYAFGHLFELYSIEDYLKVEKQAWNMEILPFVPDKFLFRLIKDKKTGAVDPGLKKQFGIIKALCNRKDVTEIVNCGDGDREGEAIIRLVIRNCIPWDSKKLTRLWLEEQTILSVREGLNNLKPETYYDNIANEGFARIYEDWLYGINGTRYATLKANGYLLRVGRVLTAIVKEIYDRDTEIENFVPVKYYALVSDEETKGTNICLESKQKYEIDDDINAIERCGKLNSAGAYVKKIEKKQVFLKEPKLFSTTTIQNAANKLFKMIPSQCSKVLQFLYENGYITYPRVNTEYLGETDKPRIREIVNIFAGNGYDVVFKDSKTIFDNSKVESHSALTPTRNIPQKLTPEQEKIYGLIRNRFLAVFCAEKCIIDRTTMIISCYDEEFTITGDICVQKGFYKYDFNKMSERELPPLTEGEKVNINFCPTEKETKPPQHYTVTTLNNFLENPYKKELKEATDNDDEEYKAILNGLEIGTASSRASIIDKAIVNQYISCNGTTYHILPAGKYLIDITSQLGIDLYKHKSVEVSKMLKRVYRGEITIEDSVAIIKKDLQSMFGNKDKVISSEVTPKSINTKEVLGDCPLCKGSVYENKVGYACENNKKDDAKCPFIIWKSDKFVKACTKRDITANQAKSVLKYGRFKAKCKKKDNSGTYDLQFNLKMNGNYVNWETSFPKK